MLNALNVNVHMALFATQYCTLLLYVRHRNLTVTCWPFQNTGISKRHHGHMDKVADSLHVPPDNTLQDLTKCWLINQELSTIKKKYK